MIKDLKLAIGFALALWVLIFVLVSALLVMPLPKLVIDAVGLLIAPIVAFVLAKIYFKRNPGNIKDGVILAVAWLIVGAILDLAVTIQYIKGPGSYIDGLKTFYGSWTLWVSFILTIAVVVLAAKLTRGGELTKPPQQPPAQTPPAQPQPPQQPPAQTPPAQPQPPQQPPAQTPPAQPPTEPPTEPPTQTPIE